MTQRVRPALRQPGPLKLPTSADQAAAAEEGAGKQASHPADEDAALQHGPLAMPLNKLLQYMELEANDISTGYM